MQRKSTTDSDNIGTDSSLGNAARARLHARLAQKKNAQGYPKPTEKEHEHGDLVGGHTDSVPHDLGASPEQQQRESKTYVARPRAFSGPQPKQPQAEHSFHSEGGGHGNHSAAKKRNKKQRAGGSPQHIAKTSDKRFVCTNNALDRRLKSNGGSMRLGLRSECFRRGVGAGYYAQLNPEEVADFLDKWSSPYKKLIDQDLHYGDKDPPNGRIVATLPQCVARGFAVGSKKKSNELLKRRRASHG